MRYQKGQSILVSKNKNVKVEYRGKAGVIIQTKPKYVVVKFHKQFNTIVLKEDIECVLT